MDIVFRFTENVYAGVRFKPDTGIDGFGSVYYAASTNGQVLRKDWTRNFTRTRAMHASSRFRRLSRVPVGWSANLPSRPNRQRRGKVRIARNTGTTINAAFSGSEWRYPASLNAAPVRQR